MPKHTRTLITTLLTLILSIQLVQADVPTEDESQQVPVNPWKGTGLYSTGWEMGVFGGADIAQSGHTRVTDSDLPGFTPTIANQSRVGGVAGIKAGYTWANLRFSTDSHVDDTVPIAFLPSLEGELFWSGLDYKGKGSFGGIDTSLKSHFNTYTFSLDPKLKVQLGCFRPYIGFGLGGSYITADHGEADIGGLGNLSLGGSVNDFAFTVQGLAGVETYVTPHISIDLNYKFVDSLDSTLKGNGSIKYHTNSFESHIVTAGVTYHF